jgi:hypothetical protein
MESIIKGETISAKKNVRQPPTETLYTGSPTKTKEKPNASED